MGIFETAKRRRSKRSQNAILTAAAQSLEQTPYSEISIALIAAKAAAARQTVYRWWPSKAAMLLEALSGQLSRETLIPDTGSVEKDLQIFLSSTLSYLENRNLRSAVTAFLAEAQSDATFAQAFRDLLVGRSTDCLGEILDRAIRRGEVTRDIHLDVLLNMVYGAIWYRVLFFNVILDQTYVQSLIRQVLVGIKAAN